MKKIFIRSLLLLALFITPSHAFAVDSSNCDAPDTLGGESFCAEGQDYYNNSCGPRITCLSGATSFNCSTGQCVCQCGTYNPVTYPTTGCSEVPTPPNCGSQNRQPSGTTCNPSCGSCVGGYADCDGVGSCECNTGSGKECFQGACVDSCSDGYSIGYFTGNCLSLDKVTSFAASLFGIEGDLFMGSIDGIIETFLTEGPLYYFLTISGSSPFTYHYHDSSDPPYSGHPEGQVSLAADYADEANLAQYLNWDNEPASILINLLNIDFCEDDGDCGGGRVCDGGICRGTVEVGDPCEATEFCEEGLVCVAGVCIESNAIIEPSVIIPGEEGQVLTTINDGGDLIADWQDGAAGMANYLGVTSAGTEFDSNIGYDGANALCDAQYSGSHVCTSAEILDNINRGAPSHLNLPVPAVWINNGPPAYTANANDCRGWTQPNGSFYGTIWVRQGDEGVGGLSKCNIDDYRFACCG